MSPILYYWYRLRAALPVVVSRGKYEGLLQELDHVQVCAGLALDAMERDPESPAARSYLYACIHP